jgi:hypothetical protein
MSSVSRAGLRETAISFDQVVELTGLTKVIGRGTVRRALNDVGVAAEAPSPTEFLRAVPRLRARMRAFLAEAEVERNVRAIVELCRAAGGDLGPGG